MVNKQNTLRRKLDDFLIWMNLAVWLGLTVISFLFTIGAFSLSQMFEKYSVGIGFSGFTLAVFAIYLYVSDKINDRKTEDEREKRLVFIEKVCKQYDKENNHN